MTIYRQPIPSQARLRELAPGIRSEYFAEVEVHPWDQPLLVLPEHEAVRDYLIGKGTDPPAASRAARARATLRAVGSFSPR